MQHDFAYADQVFPRGLRVETCNGRTPDQIVAEHKDQIAMLPWDFDLGKFYYHRFYVMGMPAHLDTLDFVFRSPDQVLIPMSFPINTRLTYETPERQNGKIVAYLPVSKLLYIRIPDMNPDHIPFYEQGILSEGGRSGRSRREVRAAVVDIRNNGGGSDLVWRRVLGKLLDRSITCENRIGVRYSSTVLDYIGQPLPGPEEAETIPFLGSEKFLTQTSWDTLSPDADSIGVPRIYVLSDNVFSAAGTLTSLAALVEPLVSVGYTNPYSMGMGVDPFYFSLPHSSYVFRIEPAIDLTGCTSVLDVYHADVEVQVQPTLDQVLDFHNQPMEGTLEDFLIQYDPIFQAVLQLAP